MVLISQIEDFFTLIYLLSHQQLEEDEKEEKLPLSKKNVKFYCTDPLK